MSIAKLKTEGKMEYGPRAFHQDSSDAMKGDIVRGIIELITNSDDAYSSIEDNKQKKIVIEVEHRHSYPWKVIVKDRAVGMSDFELYEKITKLGKRSSGFEKGDSVRGNLGRGAKDLAAFGNVLFESVKDGKISRLIIKPTGNWEFVDKKGKKSDGGKKATKKDLEILGLKTSGTVVTVHANANVTCPRHDTLREKLSAHFQLRDILCDPLRKVELVNLNNSEKDLLVYDYPDLDVVFEGILAIDGFPKAKPRLVIKRLHEKSDEGSYDPTRPNGILVKGKRAIYDNTLFKYESDYYSGWFCGELTVPYIDQLAREYDNELERAAGHSENNPEPIISRKRDGLRESHPFSKALAKAVELPLGKLIENEKKRVAESKVGGEKTQADLKKLGKELGRIINEELKDIESEELPSIEREEPPKLSIIPETSYLYMGEKKTLTIAGRSSLHSLGDEVEIELDPAGVVEILSDKVVLKKHSSRDDVLVGQLALEPIVEGESVFITAKLNGQTTNALAEVRPSRVDIEELVNPPESIQFERTSYSVGYQKRKRLIIEAPAEFIAEYGNIVKLSSSNSGIVIKGPNVKLKFDEDLEYYTGKVFVEARKLGAVATVIGTVDGESAFTKVKVTRKEEESGVIIELSPSPPSDYRAIHDLLDKGTENERRVFKVFVNHSSIKPYYDVLGVDHPITRSLISEAIADVSARFVVEQMYRKRSGTEDFDAFRVYLEHNKRATRFLAKIQRIMIGDAKPLSNLGNLEPSPLLKVIESP